jgi:catechol 2,3-dioxygenase-like lactoylglutathione lyase family enzyme
MDRSDDVLRLRGSAATSPVYIALRGPQSRCVSVAFLAASRQDLDILHREAGASQVQPGLWGNGGETVSLTDPNGIRVDVVWGLDRAASEPGWAVVPVNYGTQKNRRGQPHRLPDGAPEVQRLGHVGINVLSFAQSFEFYASTLGMLPSDRLYDGEPSNLVGGFIRCDRGEEWADHHSLALFEHPRGRASIHHTSFEMQDMDAVILARDFLAGKGWTPYWGVGRHVLGSQVFDYWRDPFGNLIEHYADGDVCNAHTEGGTYQRSPELRKAWGPAVPSTFMD